MMAERRSISVVMPIYRDRNRALAAADALHRQHLPPTYSLEIILADDGSDDGTTEWLTEKQTDILRVVSLSKNSGRSVARNAGARCALGEYLIFLDCDCLPENRDFLMAHIETLDSGYVASFGHVTGNRDRFWGRYQYEASLRRQQQHMRGDTYTGSSQNCAVRKTAFEQCGGFDNRYRRYGFEDRDLFVRLSRLGPVGWSTRAVVRHCDRLTLSSVLAKMRDAANSSADLFARDHPDAYHKLGYAAIDARLHHWLRPIGMVFGPLVFYTANWTEFLLQQTWVPYQFAKLIVKISTALAFLYGSTFPIERSHIE